MQSGRGALSEWRLSCSCQCCIFTNRLYFGLPCHNIVCVSCLPESLAEKYDHGIDKRLAALARHLTTIRVGDVFLSVHQHAEINKVFKIRKTVGMDAVFSYCMDLYTSENVLLFKAFECVPLHPGPRRGCVPR